MSGPVDLGVIECPSGILVILDMGYMELWSGSAEPTPNVEGFDDPEARARVESSADYVIVGKDAAAVARMADFQQFHFIYDMPEEGAEKIRARIAGLAQEHGLDARLEREPRRIPHRVRAQRAADLGGGDFVMQGPWVAVVGGLPADPMPVRATVDDYGGHVGVRMTEISIGSGRGRVDASSQIGWIGVDYGLAVLGDADALGDWRHLDPLDGLFDVAFWGRDETDAARDLGAAVLSQGLGWRDVSRDDARQKLGEVRTWLKSDPNRKLVFEARPHSHYHLVMEQIRSTANECGVLELDGARLMGMSTSWGDGAFPVWADRNERNEVVAVRLVLGDEDRRKRMEQVWERARSR